MINLKHNLLTLPVMEKFLDNDLYKMKYREKQTRELVDMGSTLSPFMSGFLENSSFNFEAQQITHIKDAGLSKMLMNTEAKGLKAGVDTLLKHIEKKSKIVIVSDYDADGVGSAAVLHLGLVDFLAKGCEVINIVNNREFGNGVNIDMINRILTEHETSPVGLVITCDHGSSDGDRFPLLKDVGIDVIVTDHHLVPEDHGLEAVDAFINPQQDGCPYHTGVSGCVVAFLLLDGLRKHLDLEDDHMRNLYPILMITTLSDMMPMNEPINRKIVKEGLTEIQKQQYPSYVAILESLGRPRILTARTISFRINPMINAPGRIDDATHSFNFLISPTLSDAIMNLKVIAKINTRRKAVQGKIVEKSFSHGAASTHTKGLAFTLGTEAEGVQGIVAGNVGEAYNKPTVCLVKLGDIYSGSGRGILPGFSIRDVFHQIHEKDRTILKGFGGHAGAAGCKVIGKKLDLFLKYFEEIVSAKVDTEDIRYTYTIDTDLNDSDISFDTLDEIDQLEPFGYKFDSPKFIGMFNFTGLKPMKSVPGLNFITFTLPNGKDIKGVFRLFNLPSLTTALNSRVVVIFSLSRNFFLGRESIDISVDKIIHNKTKISDNEYSIDLRDYSENDYVGKDTVKFSDCNKLISRGVKNSASSDYSKHPLANTGVYSYTDIVGISVNGARKNRVPVDLDEISTAISAGVNTFVIDNIEDRARGFNTGERELAETLIDLGFKEDKGNGIFIYKV